MSILQRAKTDDFGVSVQPVESEKSGETPVLSRRRTRGTAGLSGPQTDEGALLQLDAEIQHTNVNGLGRVYEMIMNSYMVVRYFFWMFPVSALLAVPIILGSIKFPGAALGGVRIVWIFAWAEVVWNSLWICKLLAKMIPGIYMGISGAVSASTRKYFRVIQALEVPISLMGWMLISWLTFLPLMTRNPDQRSQKDLVVRPWQYNLSQILAAGLISTIVYFIEKLSIQLITINYHRMQFSGRIHEAKRHVQLLGFLYDASTRLYPAYCDEFAEDDYLIANSIMASGVVGQRPVPASAPLKVARGVGRLGERVGSVFGHIAQELTGMKSFESSKSHTIVIEALEHVGSSEALGRRLYQSFNVKSDADMTASDFLAVLGKDRATEADECFLMFDKDANGDVSELEMTNMVVECCNVGRSLAQSMHDVRLAVRKLDDILVVGVLLVAVYVFTTFLTSSATSMLISNASTVLLGLSWLFGGTAGEFLNSCVFVFAKHPFDIGDRVDIGDQQLIVEHIDLLYTMFQRIDSSKSTQVPNSTLASLWIDNVTRSKAARDQVVLSVSFDTSMQDIDLLKGELSKFVIENSRDYKPEVGVSVAGVAELSKLELKATFHYKSNWSNEALKGARRHKFMCAVVDAVRRIPIHGPGGGDPPLGDASKPSYSVSVSAEEAARAREKWTQEKQARRLE